MFRLFILLAVVLLCGCNASRKAIKEESLYKEIQREEKSRSNTVIDTTMTESGVMEIVKLKFDLSPTPDRIPADRIPNLGGSSLKTAGGTNLPGQIKEAEIITIRQDRDKKGVSTTEVQKGIKESSEQWVEMKSDKKTETGFPWIGPIVAAVIGYILGWILFKKNPP